MRVEVGPESLYEATPPAIHTLKAHNCEPRGLSQLEIESRMPITHTVTPKKSSPKWLGGYAKSPKDAVLKIQLRELL